MTYRELQDALETFGLGERATLKEVKARHRALAKAHHPDRVGAVCLSGSFLSCRGLFPYF